MARFVLEIGTEEIPARFLGTAEAALLSDFQEALSAAGIKHGNARVFSTPRRLALVIDDMAETQPEREEIIIGPPVAAAYSNSGEPTRALLGFADANGISPEDVIRQSTEKGEYVACRKKSGGAPTLEVLAEIAPRVISGLPFAKRMRWGANQTAYARPMRWILALLDGEVVPFKVAPVYSGRKTWGHRVHGQGPFTVDNAADYERTVEEKCAVVIDPEERKKHIRQEGDRLASQIGGSVLWKDSLLEEVSGLVEKPVPIMADFDPSYLEVPAEALLTSMESHQKSFGIMGADGRLMPHFLTTLNLTPTDMAQVKKGWERVLRARLEDARFFWHTDLKDDFNKWLARLDNVIFIGPLGSMGEKSRRLEKLCEWLAWQLVPEDLNPALAARAGLLAKADLMSSMVGEFDTLQGIMGGIYAEKAGEDPVVAKAIREQYLPAGPDSPLPESIAGSILSMADKADTLAGCFGLDMVPTGAADPNGLRRCALGIIRILTGRNWHLDVATLFAKARELYGNKDWKLDPEQALAKLMEFFRGRLRNYFINLGYDTVLVDAVVTGATNDPTDARARLDALAAFSGRPDYVEATQTLKRVDNMARKSAARETDWDTGLLAEDAEKTLAATLERLLPELDRMLANGEYMAMLETLQHLREPVNGFFDNVLVLCDDEKLKNNRLKLLNAIGSRFGKIAEFSQLQI